MILSSEFINQGPYGEPATKVYNDWANIQELTSFSDAAAHRTVDKIVLSASESNLNVKTAIVCPPMIYGVGRGPDNRKSMQIYEATDFTLTERRGFKIGKGLNIWNQVHVHDLSKLFLLLGEAAVAGGYPATWNDQGYYLAESGEIVIGDLCEKISEVAHEKGLIPSGEVTALTFPGNSALSPLMAKLLGTNSRGTSIRAKKLLDWQPKERSIIDEVPDVVDSEARYLGLIKGHAEMVLN
jgi:nucleoside-diphosphate-sugar epimerase